MPPKGHKLYCAYIDGGEPEPAPPTATERLAWLEKWARRDPIIIRPHGSGVSLTEGNHDFISQGDTLDDAIDDAMRKEAE